MICSLAVRLDYSYGIESSLRASYLATTDTVYPLTNTAA